MKSDARNLAAKTLSTMCRGMPVPLRRSRSTILDARGRRGHVPVWSPSIFWPVAPPPSIDIHRVLVACRDRRLFAMFRRSCFASHLSDVSNKTQTPQKRPHTPLPHAGIPFLLVAATFHFLHHGWSCCCTRGGSWTRLRSSHRQHTTMVEKSSDSGVERMDSSSVSSAVRCYRCGCSSRLAG